MTTEIAFSISNLEEELKNDPAFSISNLEEELKNDPDNIGCFVGWVHSEQLNYLVYLGK